MSGTNWSNLKSFAICGMNVQLYAGHTALKLSIKPLSDNPLNLGSNLSLSTSILMIEIRGWNSDRTQLNSLEALKLSIVPVSEISSRCLQILCMHPSCQRSRLWHGQPRSPTSPPYEVFYSARSTFQPQSQQILRQNSERSRYAGEFCKGRRHFTFTTQFPIHKDVHAYTNLLKTSTKRSILMDLMSFH